MQPSSFPYYTNPYTQQQQQHPKANHQVDYLLNQLEDGSLSYEYKMKILCDALVSMHCSNSTTTIPNSNGSNSGTLNEWNPTMAIRFIEYVLLIFQKNNNNKNNNADKNRRNNNMMVAQGDNEKKEKKNNDQLLTMALLYLANAMQQWDDCFTYSVCVHLVDDIDNNKTSCLQQQQQQQQQQDKHEKVGVVGTFSTTFLQALQVQLITWLQGHKHELSSSVLSSPTATTTTTTTTTRDVEMAALIVMTTAWDALSRLDMMVSSGNRYSHISDTTNSSTTWVVSLWWMPPTLLDWDIVIFWILNIIQTQHDDCYSTTTSTSGNNNSSSTKNWQNEYPILYSCRIQSEYIQALCARHLIHLIHNGYQTNWIYHHQQQQQSSLFFSNEMRHMLTEAQRLSDPDMPFSSYTLLSLAYLHLSLVLQVFLDDSGDSSSLSFLHGLMDNLLYAAFGTVVVSSDDGHEKAPRWAMGVMKTGIRKICCSVISTILSSSSLKLHTTSLTRTMESHPMISSCSLAFWKVLLLTDNRAITNEQDCLDCLVQIHQHFPVQSRESLLSSCSVQSSQDEASILELCQTTLRRLLHFARQQYSLPALTLLRSLLSDRPSVLMHDKLSRCFWERIDVPFLQDCWDLLVTLTTQANVSDHVRPHVLCILDILHMIVSTETKVGQSLLVSLSAHSIETLIHIMNPTETRIEKSDADVSLNMSYNLLDEGDESTPTVHNLSRLGDTSICIEEKRIDRGMDESIRLSCATLLATLGSHPIPGNTNDSRVTLVQTRMTDAVNSFLAQIQLSLTASEQSHRKPECASFDLTRRRLRLIKSASISTNEEFVAGILFASQHYQTRQFVELQSNQDRTLSELQEQLNTEKARVVELETSLRRLNSEAAILQRERCIWHQKAAKHAKKMVEVHQSERLRASKVADELSTQMKAVQCQLIESKEIVEACSKSEAEMRILLEQAGRKNQELESREQSLCRRLDLSEAEMLNMTTNLKSVRDSHDELVRKEKQARALLEEREQSLEDIENAERVAHESLESLFADMVSLARLYEMKEKEVLSAKEGNDGMIQKLKRKLEVEQKQKAEMEEALRQLQYDNEVLSQKYAKTREKLETEREERRHEADRIKRTNGPISYINQLHRSIPGDNDSRQTSHGKENKLYSSSRSGSSGNSRHKHH